MVTLYWIAFLPPRKSYRIGILLTHMNGDFDTISMTERNCVTPISKVESHALDTSGVYTLPDNLSCRLTFDCFFLPSFYVLLGTLRSNDADDNENVKKTIGLISKTAISHVHHTFLYISFPFLHDCDVKMPNFAFYAGRKQATTKFYFSF